MGREEVRLRGAAVEGRCMGRKEEVRRGTEIAVGDRWAGRRFEDPS